MSEARWFALTAFALILANAAVLGIETYSGIADRWDAQLRMVEHGFLVAFTLEIILRACAHADRPAAFFRDPWNLFDLAVVLCACAPAVRENATVLRLLRLARVVRAARFLPQLRIVLVAVGRSLPGTVSFVLVGTLLLYVYAMVGWVFFADADPGHFGSIGRAALTLFLLVTLDGLGDSVRAGLEISRWSIFYYASYVLIASFILVNVLIGVVITSLEEARTLEEEEAARGTADARDGQTAARDRQADGAGGTPPAPPAPRAAQDELQARIATARRALDDLEESLRHLPAPHPREELRSAQAGRGHP
ncbi:ion transporter [Streptomyces sp. NPDC002564]|uniref:ion transporter n=1 Tax=Streptomyces sp. NPDC002564 TaxID=3364649 RepID=UPI0036CF4F64